MYLPPWRYGAVTQFFASWVVSFKKNGWKWTPPLLIDTTAVKGGISSIFTRIVVRGGINPKIVQLYQKLG